MRSICSGDNMKLSISLALLLYFFQQYNVGCNNATDPPEYTEDALLKLAARQQVSVRRYRKDAYSFGVGHVCSGSLVSLNVVLTAAHCFIDQSKFDGSFVNKSDFYVILGTSNLYQSNNNTLMLLIKKLLIKTSKFNLNSYSKDIALIVVKGSVSMSHPGVGPIPIANFSPPSNTRCQLSGWGSPERIFHVDMLFIVNVSLYSDHDCFEQTNFSKSDMKCAGLANVKKPDYCIKDTGGPIICNGQLTGIVSWGIQCGQVSMPAVYTDLAHYKQWIQRNIIRFPPNAGAKGALLLKKTPKKGERQNSNKAVKKFPRPSSWQVFCIILQCISNF